MNNNMQQGHYLGTETNGKWWRRYSKDGLLARGNGDYLIDASAFYFRRYLTDTPIVIPFRDVVGVSIGKWHSGRWAFGQPVVKIVWWKAGIRLNSGFILFRDLTETKALVAEIRKLVGEQAASSV